jgi:hypothetical protein
VRAKVDKIRGQMLDRISGALTQQGLKAVRQIARLAERADSDSTKLQAARTLLDHMLEVRTHVEISERLTKVEAKLQEPDDNGYSPKGMAGG